MRGPPPAASPHGTFATGSYEGRGIIACRLWRRTGGAACGDATRDARPARHNRKRGFLSGHADVSTTVSAIKAGVLDVLEKPVHQAQLLERVRQALDRDAQQRHDHSHRVDISHRLDLLSEREKEVMQLLVTGHNSKQIASQLGITPKTAMKHRSRVLEKLEVDSVVQIARLLSNAPDDTSPQQSSETGSA